MLVAEISDNKNTSTVLIATNKHVIIYKLLVQFKSVSIFFNQQLQTVLDCWAAGTLGVLRHIVPNISQKFFLMIQECGLLGFKFYSAGIPMISNPRDLNSAMRQAFLVAYMN